MTNQSVLGAIIDHPLTRRGALTSWEAGSPMIIWDDDGAGWLLRLRKRPTNLSPISRRGCSRIGPLGCKLLREMGGEEVCLDLGNGERLTAKDFVRSTAKGFPSEREGKPEGKHGQNEVSSGSQRHTKYCSHEAHCDISCEFTHGMTHEPIAISLWPIRPRNGPDLDGTDPPRTLRVSERERIPTHLRPLSLQSRVRTRSPATRLGRPAL